MQPATASQPKPWIVYVRVSTEEQAREGVSLAAQRSACEAMLRAGSVQLVEVVEDGGWSAKDLARPGAQAMLARVDRGDVAGVCVYRLDRLTRSLRDLLDLLDRFERAKVAMRSVSEMLDTSSPMGRFFVSLLGAIAQWERETIAERVKMGKRHRMAEGGYVGASVPAGMRVIGEPGKRVMVPDERWREVVGEAWRMAAGGSTLHTIVEWLDAQGLVPVNRGGKSRGAWSKGTLHYWLTNKRLVGHLVDRETFDRACAALASRRTPKRATGVHVRATERVWPLQGLARCLHCGGAMIGHTANARGKAYPYLRCAQRHRDKRSCPAKDLPAAPYEAAVVRAIVDAVSDEEDLRRTLAEQQARAQGAASTLEAERVVRVRERDALRERVGRIVDLVADGDLAADAAKPRLAEAQRQLVALDQVVAGLEGRLAAARLDEGNAALLVEEIRRGAARLTDAPPEEQAEDLRLLVREVRIGEDALEVDLWPDARQFRTEVRNGGAGWTVCETALCVRRSIVRRSPGRNRALEVALA